MAKIPRQLREYLEKMATEAGPVALEQRIFESARNYHAGAMRCFELRENGKDFLPNQGLILTAFACELYLKGLFVLETNERPKRCHDLKKLFQDLSQQMRENISGRYRERDQEGEIQEELALLANTFEKWRYHYEKPGPSELDLTSLGQLCSALYETWGEIRPDLIRDDKVHAQLTAAAQGVPII